MHTLASALEWAIAVACSPRPPQPTTGPVEYVLYCSKARHPFTEDGLADLLEQTRANNERHTITGLLSYSEGHFVQVLEGPAQAIQDLYTLLERDPRHHQLHVLSRGAGPLHRFPDWRVALTKTPQDCYWLIPYVEARLHQLLKPQVPVVESTLNRLLDTFSNICTPPRQSSGMLGAAHWAARPILATV